MMAEQEMLPVEQCDRGAAAIAIYNGRPAATNFIVRGEHDEHATVQAFARHRLAATKAADERVRIMTEALREIAKGRGLADQTQIARAALAEAGGRHG